MRKRKIVLGVVATAYLLGLGMLAGIALDRMRFDQNERRFLAGMSRPCGSGTPSESIWSVDRRPIRDGAVTAPSQRLWMTAYQVAMPDGAGGCDVKESIAGCCTREEMQ